MSIYTLFFFRLSLFLLAIVGVSLADDGTISGFKVVYSAYRQCEDAPDPLVCLKARALKLLDRAITSDNIPLVDGISLTKRADSERSLKTTPLEDLPKDMEARANRVDELLWERVATFLESHSLQFRLPSFIKDQFVDEVDEQGRGKKKRLLPVLLMGLMLKGSMLAMAMKALALLAGKALLVSKMALLLAGIVALKKLFSSGGEKTTYEIVKQPIVSHSHQYSNSHEFAGDYGGHEHGGYGRSMDNAQFAAHRMAFRAQAPAHNTA
ncbi:hypothetical protein AAG570_009393 [Ranatra chinensis]|uniref:Osiris 9 n=1 Tax=Ranatra chinensis TaxID=642074 RepID=A0ABD0YZU3_9HEMI